MTIPYSWLYRPNLSETGVSHGEKDFQRRQQCLLGMTVPSASINKFLKHPLRSSTFKIALTRKEDQVRRSLPRSLNCYKHS